MKKSFGLSILVLMFVLNLAAFSSAGDAIAPTVTANFPAAGATGIAVNSSITAMFSEAMDPSTITTSTFTLRKSGSIFSVRGVVTYAILGKAKFDPNTDLAYNTTYTATITTGVKDLAGNAMAANKTWSFTTAPDTTAPTVTSTSPADNATNVAVNTSMTATFSEAMNSSTINTSSFILKDSGNNPVGGSVTYSGAAAKFTPTSQLIGGTVYTATITTVATDLSGNPLAANKTWSFTTANKTWTHPVSLTDNISPDGHAYGDPQAAMDDNGNAVIVWQQSDGTNGQIFKSEYRNGAWTHPVSLTDNISPDGQNAYQRPQAAMDNNGNAIIVWQQFDGSDYQIFKSEHRNGAWTHPYSLTDNISPNGEHATGPQVAMDDNGNAVIVWQQFNSIFKSEYRNGAWSLFHNISPGGQQANYPQVAMDNNGNAVIVWHQSDGTYSQIFKSEYRSGAWTHPVSLTDNISPDGQNAFYPQVAMDNNGNAVIVWQQFEGPYLRTFKSEYRNGAWTHPASLTDNISPDGQDAQYPQVAMDDNGDAVIVWHQSDGTYGQIFKSEYRNGAWTHPSSLTDNISPDGQHAYYYGPQTAMDDNGDAVIVWHQSDGTYGQIFKSEYRNGAWTHPSSLTDNISPDGQQATSPQTAMDDNGNAIIVWQQYDGTYGRIFKSEYR